MFYVEKFYSQVAFTCQESCQSSWVRVSGQMLREGEDKKTTTPWTLTEQVLFVRVARTMALLYQKNLEKTGVYKTAPKSMTQPWKMSYGQMTPKWSRLTLMPKVCSEKKQTKHLIKNASYQ